MMIGNCRGAFAGDGLKWGWQQGLRKAIWLSIAGLLACGVKASPVFDFSAMPFADQTPGVYVWPLVQWGSPWQSSGEQLNGWGYSRRYRPVFMRYRFGMLGIGSLWDSSDSRPESLESDEWKLLELADAEALPAHVLPKFTSLAATNAHFHAYLNDTVKVEASKLKYESRWAEVSRWLEREHSSRREFLLNYIYANRKVSSSIVHHWPKEMWKTAHSFWLGSDGSLCGGEFAFLDQEKAEKLKETFKNKGHFGERADILEVKEDCDSGFSLFFPFTRKSLFDFYRVKSNRTVEFDLATGKREEKDDTGHSASLSLFSGIPGLLYDYDWNPRKQNLHVLWGLYHYECGGDSPTERAERPRHRVGLFGTGTLLDVRPGKWDAVLGIVDYEKGQLDVGDGFLTFGTCRQSLLWRLFRFEKHSTGTSVDFLFIPVWR